MTTIGKHILNESKKRLEPTDKQCYYCNQTDYSNMEENYFIPLFKEGNRTNIIVYSSVKFSKILIGIPRCSRCYNIHQKAKTNGVLISVLSAIVIFLGSIAIWGLYGIFSMLPAIIIGVFGSFYLDNFIAQGKGILNKKTGAEANETVQDFVIQGWSFTQPNP